MVFMLEEIYEQPEAVAKAVQQGDVAVQKLVKELKQQDVRYVVIAARGTSDNAATYAKYLIEIVCGIPVALAAPSVFTLYEAKLRLERCLVLGISQSGQAEDVVQTLASARATGALTACITNVADSPLANQSEHVLLCHAGVERAVAATKTYTTTLALIALLAGQWAEETTLLEELREIPQRMHQVLPLDSHIEAAVERYRYIQECAVLARGINQATSLEAALKMTETSYLVAKPYSGADFLHGPIAMIHEGFPTFLYAPDGRAYPFMWELARKLQERAAEMIIFARSPELLEFARCPIRIPVDIDERLSPLLYIVAGQLWACRLALARGYNPDSPRGLNKVTVTR